MTDRRDYFSDATFMQPGMVVWELHSATALGVPAMFLWQAKAGLKSLAAPWTILI